MVRILIDINQSIPVHMGCIFYWEQSLVAVGVIAVPVVNTSIAANIIELSRYCNFCYPPSVVSTPGCREAVLRRWLRNRRSATTIAGSRKRTAGTVTPATIAATFELLSSDSSPRSGTCHSTYTHSVSIIFDEVLRHHWCYSSLAPTQCSNTTLTYSIDFGI